MSQAGDVILELPWVDAPEIEVGDLQSLSSSWGTPIPPDPANDLPNCPVSPGLVEFAANPSPNVARKVFLDSPTPQWMRERTNYVKLVGRPDGPAAVYVEGEGGLLTPIMRWVIPEFSRRNWEREFRDGDEVLASWKPVKGNLWVKFPTPLSWVGSRLTCRLVVGDTWARFSYPAPLPQTPWTQEDAETFLADALRPLVK